MGVALQLRRGTTAEVDAHTGIPYEIILDQTTNILYTYDATGNKHAIQGGSGTGTQGVPGVPGVPGTNGTNGTNGISPVIDTTTNTITGVDAAGTAVTVSLQAPGTSVVVDANGNLMITNPDGSITTVTVGGNGTVTVVENAIPSGPTLPTTGMVQGDFFYNTTSNLVFFYDGTAWVTAASQAIDAGATNPTTGTIGELFFNTAQQALYTHNGTAFVRVTPDPVALEATISNNLANSTPLANSILAGLDLSAIAVAVVTSFPSAANSTAGEVVFLNTPAPAGQKLYTYSDLDGNGSYAWESKVAFGDLTGTITAAQIATNTIQADHIVAGSISAGKIAVNSIGAGQIAADAITASELAADSINAIHINTNAITANELAINSVSAVHIVAGTISATQIATDAITTNELAANAVTADSIVANNIAVASTYSVAGTVTKLTPFASILTTANTNQISSFTITNPSGRQMKLAITGAGRSGHAGGAGQTQAFGVFVGATKLYDYGWSPAEQDAKAATFSYTIPSGQSATFSVRGAKSSSFTLIYQMAFTALGIRN